MWGGGAWCEEEEHGVGRRSLVWGNSIVQGGGTGKEGGALPPY